MGIIDRAIATVSPGWAVKRARNRAILAMNGAYTGARSDRNALRLFHPPGGSADADLVPALPMLRRRSRDLERNNPIARGAINTLDTSVVGSGLKPLPQIDADYLGLTEDEAEARELEMAREWSLFADNVECDLTRVDHFDGLQSLALTSSMVNGDCFAALRMKRRAGSPYALKIQLLEADRVATPPRNLIGANPPRIVEGVELDGDGAPTAIWAASRHPGDMFLPGAGKMEWTRMPVFGPKSGRRNVLHLIARRRIGQTRGEPYLAPVIETLRQVGRYSDAEIMAAVVNACFAVTMKTEGDQGTGLGTTGAEDSKGNDIEFSDPGMIYDLGPNEDISSFTPARPNAAFDPFMMSMMRHISAGLELPLEVLIKHFTASYSASRGALLEAWRFYRKRRAWLVRMLCQPVREAWLAEAALRERLDLPGFFDDPLAMRAWSDCEWVGPAPGHIQPKQEADAAATRMDSGLTTLAGEIAAYDGGNWTAKHRQQVKERKARERDGLRGAPPAVQSGPQPAPPEEPEDDDPDAVDE